MAQGVAAGGVGAGLGGGMGSGGGVASGPGIAVGGDNVVHPYAGSEVGYISNVFYEEDGAENGAAILNIIAGLNWLTQSSDPTRGGNPTGKTVDVNAGLELRYQEFLSSSDVIQSQRALGVNLDGQATFFPGREVSFYVADTLARSMRSPNFETSEQLMRIINRARLGAQWRPSASTLSGTAEYVNTIDYFEDDSVAQFANRIQHLFRLQANWQWLPVTRFYVEASQGIFTGLGDNELAGQTYKQTSFPLNLRAGVQSAITELTTVHAFFGWGFGFYSAGPSFNAPIGGVDFGWQYSPLGRFNLGFQRRFQDSINANYFADWALRANVAQQIDQFTIGALAQYIRRSYVGVPDPISTMTDVRDDNVFGVGADLRYFAFERFGFNLTYDFQLVSTDFRGAAGTGSMDDPSYVRHQVMAGAHAAF